MLPVKTYGDLQVIAKNVTVEELPAYLDKDAAKDVYRFHSSMKEYAPTKLRELSALSEELNVKSLCVKDESTRFGLKAFKGLGGSYAVFRMVCRELGLDPLTATMDDLKKEEYADTVSKMVFVTATDGNHGKGISWAAGLLGCESHVYMPKGSVEVRAQAIRDAGTAEVTITDMCYDDTVRFVADLAEKNGWYLMQDTSKDETDEVPKWIVQGYLTMVGEALEQMKEKGYDRPTHVFLQAGVGSMAGAVAGALACAFGEEKPVIAIVEPTEVACIFESARIDDGCAHPSTGTEETMMAGLNCAEPCETVWPVLRDLCEFYITCPDDVTACGMRLLAHPKGNDAPIVSGESGAVTTGLAAMIAGEPIYGELKATMGIDEHSVILTFSTEGDTDPENYRKITE
ncbi:MAG: diaminopropionate ammonia-lyase [Firmicutes bacterium]|nr:diaminopropionate ammonia-lyase [Bacillota bacterium]